MQKHSALELLLETELRHLYRAEKEVHENLETLAGQAEAKELKELFFEHREETQKQIHRLEKIFRILKIDIRGSKVEGLPGIAEQGKELLKTFADFNFTDRSKGMNGIQGEGRDLLRHFAGTDANDFALYVAGEKVENYEIAAYSALILLAEELELEEVANLLEDSLEEERGMEERLSEFAEHSLKSEPVESAPTSLS